MKKFFDEFKKFITRGNVIDMAVGVTVGSAFTAIVNGMTNFILKPIINWVIALVLGKNSLSELFTFLVRVEKDVLDEAGEIIGKEVDLANSIYIDWGSFINAVLNFFIIAFVLFLIVKVINNFRDGREKLKKKYTKEDKKAMKALGIRLHDRRAVEQYFADKAAKEEAEKQRAEEEAKEAARLERELNPTTEDLLKKILEELQKK